MCELDEEVEQRDAPLSACATLPLQPSPSHVSVSSLDTLVSFIGHTLLCSLSSTVSPLPIL